MAAINSKRIRAKYCTDNFLVLTFTIAAHIKGWFTMAKSHSPIRNVAPVVKCVDQVQLARSHHLVRGLPNDVAI